MQSLLLAVVACCLVSFNAVSTTFPERAGAVYISTICDEDLFTRFEVQFATLEEVSQVEAYQLEGFGYFYAVTATDAEGVEFVDYFKTTADEVKLGIYDYIELNERTTAMENGKTCREDFTQFPEWCSPNHSGIVCGYQPPYTFGCDLF